MKKYIYLILSGVIITACSKNAATVPSIDCSGPDKSFTTDIDPIIQSTCAIGGCHESGSTNGPGPLTSYQQVYNNRSKIREAIANGTMPDNTTLSTPDKNALLCWLDNNAPNN